MTVRHYTRHDLQNGALDERYHGPSWINVTYNTGWADRGGGYAVVQYRRVGNMVHIRGQATRSSGTETTVATLPSGFTPLEAEIFPTATNSGYGNCVVAVNGNLNIGTGGTTWVSFSGVVFRVA